MEDIIIEEYTKDKSRGEKRKLNFRHKLKRAKIYKASTEDQPTNQKPEKKKASKLSISDEKKIIACNQELENAGS